MMHAHVYFDEQSKDLAEKIREGLIIEGWCLFVGKLTTKCVGPHPQSQFEIHFVEEQLLKAIRHLIISRENLSIFVHKVTQNDLLDHTENCFWLGPQLSLDYSKLDPEGENKALDRFVLTEAR